MVNETLELGGLRFRVTTFGTMPDGRIVFIPDPPLEVRRQGPVKLTAWLVNHSIAVDTGERC